MSASLYYFQAGVTVTALAIVGAVAIELLIYTW